MEKVLQIGITNNMGGIENFLINYYRNIDKSKIQFDFINMYDTKLCFQEEFEKNGSKIYKVHNYYNHPLKYIKDVIKIIKINKYKIIHCNMNSAVMLYPLIAAKIAKAQVIIAHSHNSSSDKGIIKEILHNINKNLIPFFANTFFACSNYAGKWFFSNKILNSNNFFIINNAIDINNFKFNNNYRKKIRKKFGIKNDEIVIGHVGRFNKQKNHKTIIEIFETCLKEKNNLKLILIGTGPMQKEIEELVKMKHIKNKVIFLGQRLDVNELYQMFDIFILPSLYEGLPLVGIEAQISGCKCLFSDTITKEVKISNNTIFLPNNEIKRWVTEISNYKFHERNRNNVNFQIYDIHQNSKKLLKIYYERLERD